MFKNKKRYTYKNIIIEELELYIDSDLKNYSKIDIILFNLVPFISYPFNISNNYIIKNELKYLIKKILKENNKNFKEKLMNNIFDIYIKSNLIPADYVGIIISQLLNKFNKKIYKYINFSN